jgi:hypothetical protein
LTFSPLLQPGLPDGIFSNQKSLFGDSPEGLFIKKRLPGVGSRSSRFHVFYHFHHFTAEPRGACNRRCWSIFGHLVHFTAIWYILWLPIWYILWSIGVLFSRFGMLHQEKSGNPGFSPSVMAYDLRLLLQRWMNFLGVSIENKFCDEEHSPRDQLEYSI